METSAVIYEIVRDIEAFRALQGDWDALWHRARGEYFQSFAWCLGSLEVLLGVGGASLYCVVARRDGRLVAVWPVMVQRKLFWRVARNLGPSCLPPDDLLVEPAPDARQIVASAWTALLKSASPDIVALTRVRATSPLHACASGARWITRREQESTPVARLRGEPDWKTLCRTRTNLSRKMPDKLERRLAKEGAISVEFVEPGDPRMATLVDWLLEHKRAWAVRGDVDSKWLFSADSRQFLLHLLSHVGVRAQPFRLVTLHQEGKLLAINVVAIQDDIVELFMSTYDAAFRQLRPSTVLIDACVKWAFHHERDFGFGSGLQPYKLFWTNGNAYDNVTLQIPHTWWGLGACKLQQTAEWARRRVAAWRGRPAMHDEPEAGADAAEPRGIEPRTT
jgi:CelD/BcsL family acetyltransferase involved in cellulose biosynthesis